MPSIWALFKEIRDGWPAVRAARWTIILGVALGFAVGFGIATYAWNSTVSGVREANSALKERVSLYEAKLKVGSPEEAANKLSALEKRIANLENPTFDENAWPKAIRCKWVEMDSTKPSSLQFLYLETGYRKSYGPGPITVYSFSGNRVHDKWGYIPHQLWFDSKDRKLFRPDKIADSELSPDGQRYKAAFLSGVDCGGETIKEIETSGNAVP